MADGDAQAGTLLDDLAQLGHLPVAILQSDAQEHVVLLHQVEHPHHLCRCERFAQQTMTGNGNTAEALLHDEPTGFLAEFVLQVVGHTAADEAVAVALTHLFQIVVL